jgi:hypothetical protein
MSGNPRHKFHLAKKPLRLINALGEAQGARLSALERIKYITGGCLCYMTGGTEWTQSTMDVP